MTGEFRPPVSSHLGPVERQAQKPEGVAPGSTC